jgi:hypothetical protein
VHSNQSMTIRNNKRIQSGPAVWQHAIHDRQAEN